MDATLTGTGHLGIQRAINVRQGTSVPVSIITGVSIAWKAATATQAQAAARSARLDFTNR